MNHSSLSSRPARAGISAPLVLIAFCCALGVNRDAAPPNASTASAPAGRIVSFQPGVRIDFARRQVELDGKVVLREGPLELFACSGRTKAHESVVSLTARPMHVFQALGLMGATSAGMDEKGNAAHADRADQIQVMVRWIDKGRERIEPATEWMEDAATGKPPKNLRWTFTGSATLSDGRFAADFDGTTITVVDFPFAVVNVLPAASPAAQHAAPASAAASGEAGVHVDQADDLQLLPRSSHVPPLGTPVTLVLKRIKNSP